MGSGEKVTVDETYGMEAPCKVRAPSTFFSKPKKQAMEMVACAQNEHCNRWMKQWGILHQDFQHYLKYHESVILCNCCYDSNLYSKCRDSGNCVLQRISF